MLSVRTLHRRACRVLPQVIQTCGTLPEALPQSTLAALLFPLRRRSRGAVLFRIAESTVAEMIADPVAYLAQATQARESLGRHRPPFAYRPWRATRLPGAWVSALAGPCAGPQEPVQAWFTAKTDGKALLLLIPERRLAAYFWDDLR